MKSPSLASSIAFRIKLAIRRNENPCVIISVPIALFYSRISWVVTTMCTISSFLSSGIAFCMKLAIGLMVAVLFFVLSIENSWNAPAIATIPLPHHANPVKPICVPTLYRQPASGVQWFGTLHQTMRQDH